ncbi:S-layer homology domain-containing protein [uncultured Oscillibacter sp.]|uniref:S-layer homology domain-containing protein n=1 Tax=uncultured Oscillibacter sp. TaxID=876091 RepID=UPI00260FF3E1|nr:S-layer homology domain-containing protein [uncultured Oscillibacter sp.]
MKKRRIAALLLALALCLGLLPMTAMAEETEGEHKSFTITFDANGGKFPDGSATWTTQATWQGAGCNITEDPPFPQWVNDDYTFTGWDAAPVSGIKEVDFTADATVKATWQFNSNVPSVSLNPNGGTLPAGAETRIPLDRERTLRKELPVPTRGGYTFVGWYQEGYSNPVKTGDVFSDHETELTAKWSKIRTSKITPGLTASPAKIEAGTKKIEIILSCPDSGVSLDWRPLERALYTGGAPSDWEAAAKSLLSGNFSAVGLKLTNVSYQDTRDDCNYSAYPREFYPEGVCPADGLALTLEGEAKAGTLTIQLGGSCFLEFVPEGKDTVLDASSANIFNAAKVSIPVGGGAAAEKKDGPFTVKFDLNYKDPKEDEIPKEKTVAKGNPVGLPDGSKLTPPASNYEFYAWCIEGKDGKLYRWKESNPVTEDMTLYAGWVKKGTVVKDGQAIDSKPAETQKPAESEKPAETQKPAETPASKFADVAATSPFAPAISWAVEKRITNGKTDTAFGPGDPCTRAQIVTFLWRAAGSPEPKLTETQYMDVTDPGAYYYKAVQWAAELDMEYSGTFDPHKTCDRASAAYFIWKAFGSPKAAAKSSFTDMPEEPKTGGQWYWPDLLDAVDWAVGQGVTNGTGDGTTFSPDNPCTRGQIVTFLYRAYEK